VKERHVTQVPYRQLGVAALNLLPYTGQAANPRVPQHGRDTMMSALWRTNQGLAVQGRPILTAALLRLLETFTAKAVDPRQRGTRSVEHIIPKKSR
jgi:hypothetical protein